MTRSELAVQFLLSAGWGEAARTYLAGDASNRQYERLTKPDGTTAVLMDAPPETGEDVRPFVLIARYLEGLGLSAPTILHGDDATGFLLIEDLGDRLFTREISSNPALEQPLYQTAADVLQCIHTSQKPDVDTYDSALTVPLAALAFDWYQLGTSGFVDENAKNLFIQQFQKEISVFDDRLNVLIQRDYHAENLLWLPDRTGAARVGLLDFQSAMMGHASYDLVSVLQDARRDVSPEIETAIKTYFVDQNCHNREDFDTAYAVFGFQRNMRILGVFSRLCMRDGKTRYVDFIPRVWGHIQTNLAHPVLSGIAPLIEKSLPEPSPEICEHLRSKSGQWAGR